MSFFGELHITKRLRQIRNAWHSQFKLNFVFKVKWFRLGAGVAHYLTRRYVLWEKMDMDIPDRFKNVRYVSSRIPGCKDDSDLTLGANCQVFAYNLLRDFGLNPPNYRSSELWNDSELSEVTEFKPLSCCTTTLLTHTEHTLECTPVMDSSTICLCPMAYPSLSAI